MDCGPTSTPLSSQPTVTIQPTTAMLPSIDSAQPIAGGVPSTALPSPVDQPITAPSPANVSPATAPTGTPAGLSPNTALTPADDAPARAPTTTADDGPTVEPTINTETGEPINLGYPTIPPTMDDTKPQKQVGRGKGKGKGKGNGKGKGKGKGMGKGKGKGNKVNYGKGKGIIHVYGDTGRVKGVVNYNKRFQVYRNSLFRNMDYHFRTNDDYEDTTTDGENDNDYTLFPLIRGPNP